MQTGIETDGRPVFAYYRVFGDGMEAHEWWATYSTENRMRRDCPPFSLRYEGEEVEECKDYVIIYHDYFESC